MRWRKSPSPATSGSSIGNRASHFSHLKNVKCRPAMWMVRRSQEAGSPLAAEAFRSSATNGRHAHSRTPEAHQAALARFRTVRSGGQFAPPSLQGTIVFPGFDGGGEWGGPTWDPETGLLYVNSNEMAWILRLVPRSASKGRDTGSSLYSRNCSGCHRADRKGTPPEFPSLATSARHAPGTGDRSRSKGRRPYARLCAAWRGCSECDGALHYDRRGSSGERRRAYVRGEDIPLKYGIDGYNKFLDLEGYPASRPLGNLNAINLNTGEYPWKIPFGEIPDLAAKGLTGTGSENYGGSVVTAGGLLFIGATNFDRLFRAYDKRNGKLLWKTTLPAAGNATPAVYAVNGRQYVVIAAGGGKSGQISGGSYISFALPVKQAK